MSAPRTAFKALLPDGTSPVKHWEWPLPADDDTPGEWVEVEGTPKLCAHGFHGYHDPAEAARNGDVYEMELDGEIVEDGHKIAATRARLLRRASGIKQFEPILVERGIGPCAECGKAHDYYQLTANPRGLHSWADRTDGHCYRRENTETVIRRLLALAEGSTTGMVAVSAVKEAVGHV